MKTQNIDILQNENLVLRNAAKKYKAELEEKNRALEIEAALEAVRARSMAMQKSAELADLSLELVKQVQSLGLKTWFCAFNIYDDDPGGSVEWGSNGEGTFPKYRTPREGVFLKYYEAGQRGESLLINEIDEDECPAHYEYLCTLPGVGDQLLKMKANGIPFPTSQIDHVAFFKYGYIIFITYDPVPESLNVFKRFAKVFEQTYTRFLDLRKAEGQAREAQIEAALERVRSRSMAMRTSDELMDAGELVYRELSKLGIENMTAGYVLVNKTETIGWNYGVNPKDGSISPDPTGIPLTDSPVMKTITKSWKSQEPVLVVELDADETIAHQTYIAENATNFPLSKEELLKISPERLVIHTFNFIHGYLLIVGGKVLTSQEKMMVSRFAKAFEQTYVRFLDLQKAEAQAREAQIEAALERVRSRTMGMQKSEDLNQAASDMFGQIQSLGIKLWGCGFNIFDKDEKAVTQYMSLADGGISPPFRTPLTEDPFFINIYEARQRGDKLLVWQSEGESLAETYHYMFGLPGSREIFGDLESSGFEMPKFQITHCAYFSQGYLVFITYEPVPQAHNIFKRFARLFEQTYARFLDLQRAEVQAREAEIQLALERVRSAAMAMHSSNELSHTIKVLFEQLNILGMHPVNTYLVLYDLPNNQFSFRMTGKRGSELSELMTFSFDKLPGFKPALKAWKAGAPVIEAEYLGESRKKWLDLLKPMNSKLPKENQLRLNDFPNGVFSCSGRHEFGSLGILKEKKASEEEKELLKRFAKEFNQTYTRFLDLKKAEAQAREAQIEASLEKVRGKAMAMHNSEDLSDTASMVFTELRKLGVNPIRSGVGLFTKESRRVQLYSAISSESGDSLSLVGWVQLEKHPVLEKIYETWLQQEDYFPEMQGEQLRTYYQLLLRGLSVPIPDFKKNQKQFGHFIHTSIGCLYAWSDEHFSEEQLKILRRFASIVDLTFRRYFELQQSEASAREAIKQAALDRIRADIASMRTVSDLERITPLIWNELTALGIPFIRCGVFIMDNEKEVIQTYLSTPEGKSITSFDLPFETPGKPSLILKNWEAGKRYIDAWSESDFSEFAQNLVKEGVIRSADEYLNTLPQTGFYLHFLHFLQGMLYVANTTRLVEDELNLIQAVADSFSTAYARYEDFKKLEEAKQQVEHTLTDLRQTQQQLVQSEKMASLGELTAGIAHEIKNPLNFVNNFSEVSKELLEEMNEELKNGNYELVAEIAEDVNQNLEKILHHGKRADGIVKGMLQHSRSNSGQKEEISVNNFVDEYLRLAYHGLRAKDKSFNAKMETDFDTNSGKIMAVPQELGRVILNLLTNAFYAVNDKKKKEGEEYEPTVWIKTHRKKSSVEIKVVDNGGGIPEKIRDKIFQPFFTTKPTGEGTGLGLSLSYDIVKAHGGDLTVDSDEGKGTTFILTLKTS